MAKQCATNQIGKENQIHFDYKLKPGFWYESQDRKKADTPEYDPGDVIL